MSPEAGSAGSGYGRIATRPNDCSRSPPNPLWTNWCTSGTKGVSRRETPVQEHSGAGVADQAFRIDLQAVNRAVGRCSGTSPGPFPVPSRCGPAGADCTVCWR